MSYSQPTSAKQMTPAQLRTVQRITRSVDRDSRYATMDGYLNGPVKFHVEQWAGGVVALVADNSTDEKKWFETHCFAIAVIGKRGGVELKHCEGFARHSFGHKSI